MRENFVASAPAVVANGVGKRSGLENFTASGACDAERRLMTICAGRLAGLELAGWRVEGDWEEYRELNVVAIREGIRRANAMRGYGSIAIDVKEDSVAPWNVVVSGLS